MTVSKPYQTFSLPVAGPWILAGIWLLVQGLTLWHYGIVEAIDSDFYLDNARLLSQEHIPTDRGLWYISYSFFLAVIFALGGNLIAVVAFQILFSGVAAIALYKVVCKLFQSYTVAFLAVLQYLLWTKIHQWNSYIYTESLFISFSILSFTLLCFSKEALHYIFTALVIAFTVFLRPTGICFFTALCAYFIYLLWNKKKISLPYLLLTVSSTILLVSVLLNILLKEYIYYFIDSYSKAEIIYPNISFLITRQPLDIPSSSHPPLLQLAEFICYNPIYFLKLFGVKCLLFWGNVKAYFSWMHNAMIIVVLYPIYGFAVYGFKKMSWSKEKVFMLSLILMQTLTVSMTSENWDGRFLILILPFVFIYAAYGINFLLKKRETKGFQTSIYKGP